MDTLPEEILQIIYRKVYTRYIIQEMKNKFIINGLNFECCNCGSKYYNFEFYRTYNVFCSHYCEREYYCFNRFE